MKAPRPPPPPERLYVRPAREGVNVRDPVSKLHIPAGGKFVPVSSFWIRCLAAGDIEVCQPPAPVVQVNQIPDSNEGQE